jgi:ubiquinol-cytochrome c reductase cytochrome c subunit
MPEHESPDPERTFMTDDDAELDAEFGFESAIPVKGSDRPEPGTTVSRSRAGGAPVTLRKRVASVLVLLVALVSMGVLYGALAGSSNASSAADAQAQIDRGRQLFETSCITCHGANLQGVTNRGVSLIGVGSAAVYFQVGTGRMPAAGQGAEQLRKTAKYDEADTLAIAAYVQSVGGGPVIPDGSLRTDDKNIAMGGELFRLNCAACHGFSGKGAPLSAGKTAPGLNEATDKQIYAAMLTGPESMPVFSDNQLTPDQKKAIVTYVQTLKASKDPGGAGLDRIGPVSEGLIIWIFGIGFIVVTILWIGAKS